MKKAALPLAFLLTFTSGVWAQDRAAKQAFVEANILAIFYHELGHALIDLMEVPIFGQEEDAADVMSVLLIDWSYDEDTAQALAYDSAFGYLSDPEGTQEIAYWDVHGPDEQRFYNHVCLFYGANPEARDDLAADLGLPDERAAYCPDEYQQAADSWGMIFDRMEQQNNAVPITFVAGADRSAALANRILSAEIQNMNREIKLPEQLTVRVDSCGEANAFYDPQDVSITLCDEFSDHLEDIYDMTAAR